MPSHHVPTTVCSGTVQRLGAWFQLTRAFGIQKFNTYNSCHTFHIKQPLHFYCKASQKTLGCGVHYIGLKCHLHYITLPYKCPLFNFFLLVSEHLPDSTTPIRWFRDKLCEKLEAQHSCLNVTTTMNYTVCRVSRKHTPVVVQNEIMKHSDCVHESSILSCRKLLHGLITDTL